MALIEAIVTPSSSFSLKLVSAHVPKPALQMFDVSVWPVVMSTTTVSPTLTDAGKAVDVVSVASPLTRRAVSRARGHD